MHTDRPPNISCHCNACAACILADRVVRVESVGKREQRQALLLLPLVRKQRHENARPLPAHTASNRNQKAATIKALTARTSREKAEREKKEEEEDGGSDPAFLAAMV